MAIAVFPGRRAAAIQALHVCLGTLKLPMLQKLLDGLESRRTPAVAALELSVAVVPVRLPPLIGELTTALVALELESAERLHHKSVDFGAVEVSAAAGAGSLFREPLRDASAAVEPVAVATLLWCFNHSDANVATEHVLEVVHSLFRLDVPWACRLLGCSGLDQCYLPSLDLFRIDYETM